MPVDAVSFSEAYNADRATVAAADMVELKRDSVMAERDLGCERVTTTSAPDNYAKLAPLFRYETHTHLELVLDGVFGCSQTLDTTHRYSLAVKGRGNASPPHGGDNWGHSGVYAPGAFQHAGPIGGLIYTGAPGGTLLRVWNSHGLFERVHFQGQYNTNGNAVKTSINYKQGAGILVHVRDNPNGAENEFNLVTPPYWITPGKTDFVGCSFAAASVGVWWGTSRTGTNHGDHGYLPGCHWYWVEDAMVIQGMNSVHFTVPHPNQIEVKRVVRLYNGGQVKIDNGRLQGQTPTLLHVCGAEVNNGNVHCTNFNVDGTLVNRGEGNPASFRYMDYREILEGPDAAGSAQNTSAFFPEPEFTQAGRSIASLILDGGRIEGRPQFFNPAEAGPIAYLKGGMLIEFRSYRNLPRWILGMKSMPVTGWGGSYTGPLPPIAFFGRCIYETHTYASSPEQISSPEFAAYGPVCEGAYRIISRDCFTDVGDPLIDQNIFETGD